MTRFRVSRTSARWDDDCKYPSPCEGAFRAPYVRIDYRTFKTEAEHDRLPGKPWRAEGRNHRTWESKPNAQWREGGICRDFDDEDWFIEIADVMAFVEKHGQCVVSLEDDGPHIEIYDGYRE